MSMIFQMYVEKIGGVESCPDGDTAVMVHMNPEQVRILLENFDCFQLTENLGIQQLRDVADQKEKEFRMDK